MPLPHRTVFGPFSRDDTLTAAFFSPQVLLDTPEIFAEHCFATTASVGTSRHESNVLFIDFETANGRVKWPFIFIGLLILAIGIVVSICGGSVADGAAISGTLYTALAVLGGYIFWRA